MDIPKNIVSMIMYAIALAMGVVSIILPIVGQPVNLTLLAIGMTALGIAGLDQIDNGNISGGN
ncbi:MAG: hypothetical protein GY870_21895 [archaeon]|nr:hypothetical protein [archaeon]